MPYLSDRALQRLQQQAGVITRPQLLAMGFTKGQIEGHVTRGNLEVVRLAGCPLVGTYRLTGAPVPTEQPLVAAVARCRPKARLTGPALLGLLGADGFEITDPIVVLVAPGRRVQNVPFHVWTDLAPDRDHASVGPVRGVTGTRALIDTAAFPGITDEQIRHAADSLFWAGQSSVGRLGRRARELDRRRHRGAAVILRTLAAGVFVQESEGERALARILHGVDPQPRWGMWLAPDIRVDAVWIDVKLVLEYDGREHHTRERDRARDQARRRRLEALGYTVVVVTAEDLRDPAALRARLLGLREGLLARR